MLTKYLTGAGLCAALILSCISCQKVQRPTLGDFPSDSSQSLPSGSLRFFLPFNGTTGPSARWNIADSISGNPAQIDPFTSIPGITGNAVQGVPGSAITYLNTNDFAATATSFSMAFWIKSGVPHPNAQFVFSLVDKDYWHNSGLFMLIDHDGAGSTVDSAAVTFAIKDNWFVFHGADRIPRILDQQWHHLAFVYSETTSMLSTYVDGNALTGLSADATHLAGLSGPLNLNPASVSNFVLGGWNKHANIAGPTDSWIESFPGGLDQVRLYNKALDASEILALYNSKL